MNESLAAAGDQQGPAHGAHLLGRKAPYVPSQVALSNRKNVGQVDARRVLQTLIDANLDFGG